MQWIRQCNEISNTLDALGLSNIVTSITRPASNSCLDHVYAKVHPDKVSLLTNTDSDHLGVHVSYEITQTTKTNQTMRTRLCNNTYKRIIKQADWAALNNMTDPEKIY